MIGCLCVVQADAQKRAVELAQGEADATAQVLPLDLGHQCALPTLCFAVMWFAELCPQLWAACIA